MLKYILCDFNVGNLINGRSFKIIYYLLMELNNYIFLKINMLLIDFFIEILILEGKKIMIRY